MQSAAGRVCKALVMVVSIPIVARLAFADDPKICTMKPDGSECRTLVEMPGYDRVGSPAFSHDGRFIAFDGTRDNLENNHIFIMDAAGGPPRDIGLGARLPGRPTTSNCASSCLTAIQRMKKPACTS